MKIIKNSLIIKNNPIINSAIKVWKGEANLLLVFIFLGSVSIFSIYMLCLLRNIPYLLRIISYNYRLSISESIVVFATIYFYFLNKNIHNIKINNLLLRKFVVFFLLCFFVNIPVITFSFVTLATPVGGFHSLLEFIYDIPVIILEFIYDIPVIISLLALLFFGYAVLVLDAMADHSHAIYLLFLIYNIINYYFFIRYYSFNNEYNKRKLFIAVIFILLFSLIFEGLSPIFVIPFFIINCILLFLIIKNILIKKSKNPAKLILINYALYMVILLIPDILWIVIKKFLPFESLMMFDDNEFPLGVYLLFYFSIIAISILKNSYDNFKNKLSYINGNKLANNLQNY